MKCKYRFSVRGKLRLDSNVPVTCAGLEIQAELQNGILHYLTVTIPVPNKTDWPTVRENPQPGVKLHINATSPGLLRIQRHLRTVQGFLSLYGLRGIDLEQPAIEWLPENEAEKAALSVFGYNQSLVKIRDEELPPLSFDLFARSLLAADTAAQLDVPLNFFRRGMIDIYERSYIEAIYDFYFMLETLFAEGKFKKAQVKAKFCGAPKLCTAIEQTLKELGAMIGSKERIRRRVLDDYGNLSVEECIEKIIALRGYLHHHTSQRGGMWHPDEQIRYEADALFLQRIAFNVVFAMASEYLWDSGVIRAYEKLRRCYAGKKWNVVKSIKGE